MAIPYWFEVLVKAEERGVDESMSKSECSRGKGIGDGRVHFRIVTSVFPNELVISRLNFLILVEVINYFSQDGR